MVKLFSRIKLLVLKDMLRFLDIGRSQLSTILINLQMKMIATLHALLSHNGRRSYASMLNVSDSSRRATISALGSQFQRLWQSAPIPRSFRAVPSRSCVLWNDTDQGVFHRECYATESRDQRGILRQFPKGSHCKVLGEADINNVWIQDAKLPGRYRILKQNLIRMRHFWRDTDQGILSKSCAAIQGWTLRGFTFKRGRECTVFDIDLGGPQNVWVKFTFPNSEWDSNVGYLVPKKYLHPAYSGGRRSMPTSVYVA